MRTFLIKEDIIFLNSIIFKQGDKIEIEDNININKEGISFSLSLEQILMDSKFEEIKKLEPIKILEINDDDYEEIKTFRLQLDVKTTKNKIIQVERKIRDYLDNYL